MKFIRTPLTESITIDHLISFHYFEYARGFVFEGEQHDFWEILYVDKGTVEVQADERTYELHQGNLIFHQPNEFHTVRVHPHHKPPNLIVISFECLSPDMNAFQNKVLTLTDQDRNLLSYILQEGFQAFLPPFDSPVDHTLSPNPTAPFGSGQMIRSHLEILLIRLVRALTHPADKPAASRLTSAWKENSEQELVEGILDYLRSHLSDPLSLDQICTKFHIGKSRLKEIFRDRLQSGMIEYFKGLKFEEAKSLIREQKYNLTEISSRLGYSSIHYFSREFKKHAGMSPSEYAKTAKAKSQVLK
jgi:AraC-like DNA-binding protein